MNGRHHKGKLRFGHVSLNIWVDKHINSLGIEEDWPHYMIYKKQWGRKEWWNQNISTYKCPGITLPFELYEYVTSQKNDTAVIILYIINDDQYFETSVGTMQKFVERYGSRFVDNWGTDVIGLPQEIFVARIELKSGSNDTAVVKTKI